MKAKRITRTFLMLVASLALASFGCKKEEGSKGGDDKGAEKGSDDKGAKKGGGDKAADKGSASTAEKGSTGGGMKTSFAVFPKDSEFVFGLNGASLRKSGLYTKFSPMLEQALSSDPKFKKFKDTCGFDPITKVQSVIFGGSIKSEQGVVVVKGFNRGEAKTCAEKMAKSEGEDLKIEEDGKAMKVTSKKDVMWLGWLDDDTVITGPGAEGDAGKAWIDGHLAGTDGLDKNTDMTSLLKQVNSGATIWFVMKPKDNSDMAMMGPPPDAMFGSVLLTSGLKVDMGIRYGSADEAKKFVDQISQMMTAMASDPTTKMLAAKTKLEARGNDAIVKLDLNEEELGKVIAMAQQMLGPMLGNMLK